MTTIIIHLFVSLNLSFFFLVAPKSDHKGYIYLISNLQFEIWKFQFEGLIDQPLTACFQDLMLQTVMGSFVDTSN